MGELIDFMEYLQAKRAGITVQQYRAAKKRLDEEIENLGSSFADYVEFENDDTNWPAGYPYVLQEDLDTGYHDDCDHLEWHVVEEGYQAACNNCDLNAWSAPW